MNRLSTERRTQILNALVEGNSIRGTCRLTGAAKGTVIRLLQEIGAVCADYHDETVQDIPARLVQCDEIWSFVGAKQKNVPEERQGERLGDAWTYVAIDAETKLVISWYVWNNACGDRATLSYNGRVIDSAFYRPNPPEGVLTRLQGTDELVPAGGLSHR